MAMNLGKHKIGWGEQVVAVSSSSKGVKTGHLGKGPGSSASTSEDKQDGLADTQACPLLHPHRSPREASWSWSSHTHSGGGVELSSNRPFFPRSHVCQGQALPSATR